MSVNNISGFLNELLELVESIDDPEEKIRTLRRGREMIEEMKQKAADDADRRHAADSLDGILSKLTDAVGDQARANAALKNKKLDIINGGLKGLQNE